MVDLSRQERDREPELNMTEGTGQCRSLPGQTPFHSQWMPPQPVPLFLPIVWLRLPRLIELQLPYISKPRIVLRKNPVDNGSMFAIDINHNVCTKPTSRKGSVTFRLNLRPLLALDSKAHTSASIFPAPAWPRELGSRSPNRARRKSLPFTFTARSALTLRGSGPWRPSGVKKIVD
ncbi:hypothetical protein VTI74DRAFT_9569 [Chaetomium olivicolor]